jgi:transcriptional regulator with XRE-family HTH domain
MDVSGLFVRNMKKWRKNRGISQKTLAERCEAAHTYIRQIESGSRTPSFAFIVKLAEALGIEAYLLFYDETATQGLKPSQMAHLKAIKSEILAQVASGIDTVIVEAQK